jgi:hypothetical protein
LHFFTVDSFKVERKDPLVVRFIGERIGRFHFRDPPRFQRRGPLNSAERSDETLLTLYIRC